MGTAAWLCVLFVCLIKAETGLSANVTDSINLGGMNGTIGANETSTQAANAAATTVMQSILPTTAVQSVLPPTTESLPPVDEHFLIWVSSVGFLSRGLYSQKLDSVTHLPPVSSPTDTLLTPRLGQQLWALASNDHQGLIYYTDWYQDHVGVYDTKNRTHRKLFQGVSFGIDGVDVDWFSGNLYWTDTEQKWIMVSEPTFKYTTVLTTIKSNIPSTIAIDAFNRTLYWSEVDTNESRIYRCDLAGNARTLLHSIPEAAYIDAMTFDMNENRLYWTERLRTNGLIYPARVRSCHSSSPQIVTEHYRAGLSRFSGIASLKEYLYVANREKELVILNKNTWQVAERRTFGHFSSIIGMTISGPYVQPWSTYQHAAHPCRNHPCSQICIPVSATSHKCACSFGYKLQADSVSCGGEIVYDRFMLLLDSDHSKIFQVPIDTPDDFTLLPIPDIGKPVSVAYDDVDGLLYYSDTTARIVYRVALNGTGKEIFLTDVRAQSISIDSVSRNVYVANSELDLISVASLQYPNHSRTLIFQGVQETFEIHVDVDLGKIFWSDYGPFAADGSNTGLIESANLDGSSRTKLVTDSSGPRGITVDSANYMLYWTEIIASNIGWYNLNTKAQGTFNVESTNGRRYRLIGLSFFNATLYVADLSKSSLTSVPASDVVSNKRSNIGKYGPSAFFSLASIHIYTKQDHVPTHCSSARGACPHICLPQINNRKCVCADHYEYISGNKTCQVTSTKNDTTPPSFGSTCPSGLGIIFKGPCSSYATFNFTEPAATDNSGQVKLKKPFSSKPPYNLSDTSVFSYTATDLSGNKAECRFVIIVLSRPVCFVTATNLPGTFGSATCGKDYGSEISARCSSDLSKTFKYWCTMTRHWASNMTTVCPKPTSTPESTTTKSRTSSRVIVHPTTRVSSATGLHQSTVSGQPGSKSPRNHSPSGISGGAIAAIVLVVIAVLVASVLLILRFRRSYLGSRIFWRNGDDSVFLTENQGSPSKSWLTAEANVYT